MIVEANLIVEKVGGDGWKFWRSFVIDGSLILNFRPWYFLQMLEHKRSLNALLFVQCYVIKLKKCSHVIYCLLQILLISKNN